MKLIISILFSLTFLLTSCSVIPGPDKTAAGAILGAAWGAGAGAVVGNQVNAPSNGAGIGAGLGAASGIMSGIGLDVTEGAQLRHERDIEALKVKTSVNQRGLLGLQDSLDMKTGLGAKGVIETIQFDPKKASIRLGSALRLEALANKLKQTSFGLVEVHGHADDNGDHNLNTRLALARAKTVVTFLISHGISSDQIRFYEHGSQLPIASNKTSVGRQLNRRVEIILKN